jgi:hypothetical protein
MTDRLSFCLSEAAWSEAEWKRRIYDIDVLLALSFPKKGEAL